MITDILTIVMAILLILIIVFFAVLAWASGVEKARRTEEWKHYGPVDKCGFDSIEDKISKEVISGKWGRGQERKHNLETAGYDYEIVQRKVNNLAASSHRKKHRRRYKCKR